MSGVTVRELTPELLDDYLQFFDRDAFSDNPGWSECYCFFHHFAGTGPEWASRSAVDNREAVSHLIQTGEFHGLLAYVDGRPAGWCQAVVRSEMPDPPAVGPATDMDYARVGCILCFVVSPQSRRRGVARRLLEAACESFIRRGLLVAEAYPVKEAATDAANYHGPLSLYLDAGFIPVREEGSRVVLQRRL